MVMNKYNTLPISGHKYYNIPEDMNNKEKTMFASQFGIFYIFFFVIVGVIIFRVVKSVSQWSYNNQQPILTVGAKVTGKRAHTTHQGNMVGNNMMHSSSTTYYATFEVESGDRMELKVPAHEYGMLSEEDSGRLTFQGTRYLGFERE